MKPVLAVFIDGLKPESVDSMDFLSTLIRRRIKVELIGYSNTCHASIYTGVYPNKHLQEFIWRYSPQTSVFKVLKRFKLNKLPHNIYSKYLCYRLALLLVRGVPFNLFFSGLAKQPVDNWCYFDFEEVKFWSEPDPFIGGYPTFLKLLKDSRISYKIVGMNYFAANSAKAMRAHRLKDIKPFTIYFVGDIDPLSDKYRQDSPEVKERLRAIDRSLEEKYCTFEKRFDDFYFMVFSDHGHMPVKERVDLYLFFRDNGRELNNYIHFIDAIQLRFWFRNEREKEEVMQVLSKLVEKKVGYFLTDEIFKKYHADMPDNRYGDLIFYIDSPYISDTTPVLSMHGYSPEYPDSDGVLVTNKKVLDEPYIKLQDIMPSILYAFGVDIPDHVDGSVIWRE